MHTNSSSAPGRPVPVVLVGGSVNAFSVARSLGRAGIPVYSLNPAGEHLCYSRYCKWLPNLEVGTTDVEWAAYLLDCRSDWLKGSVLLACNDAGVEMIAHNRDALAERFLLDESDSAAQLCMLDKLRTYQAAVRAGVPVPRFWTARTQGELLPLVGNVMYPVVVKPLLSHVYRSRFGKKLSLAADFHELSKAVGEAGAAGIDVMIVEMIPGPDSNLCSYFTYLDEDGRNLFDFTKRVIRRYPVTSGLACSHVTDHVAGLQELGLKLFREVGLRGLANVEFKFDPRDRTYKLIECNARFTASNGLLVNSGYDLARFVYDRIVGRTPGSLGPFKSGKRLIYPIEDFKAFQELRRRKELTFWQWVSSVARPAMLPYFDWKDPLPSFVVGSRRVRDAVGWRLRSTFSMNTNATRPSARLGS